MTRTPVTRITPTTTLIVSKPTDFRALEARYKLVRYELPMELQWMAKKSRTIYGQMHNSLRDQLDCPYKTFTHDRRDGAEVDKWTVYALYRHHETPTTISLSFLPHAPVPASTITFDSLEVHLLLKLLQIAHVLGEQTRRFIGQDLCYVHAKKEGNAHTCLLIEIKGDIRTEREDSEQEFKVIGQARRFQRVDYPGGVSLPYAYFGRKITDGTVYFLHLKRPEIETYSETREPLYGIRAQRSEERRVGKECR